MYVHFSIYAYLFPYDTASVLATKKDGASYIYSSAIQKARENEGGKEYHAYF